LATVLDVVGAISRKSNFLTVSDRKKWCVSIDLCPGLIKSGLQDI
jgi:hypothetical protein